VKREESRQASKNLALDSPDRYGANRKLGVLSGAPSSRSSLLELREVVIPVTKFSRRKSN
jgi:hypothetical protein